MSHRFTDLTFRGLGTQPPVNWIVAGASVKGAPYRLITPAPTVPADWPTEAEIAAICAQKKADLFAKAIRALIDDGDWAIYTMFGYIAERQEERRDHNEYL